MKKVEAKVLNKIRRPVITKLWTLNVSQRISTVLKIAVLIKSLPQHEYPWCGWPDRQINLKRNRKTKSLHYVNGKAECIWPEYKC